MTIFRGTSDNYKNQQDYSLMLVCVLKCVGVCVYVFVCVCVCKRRGQHKLVGRQKESRDPVYVLV
jgi:hypothetical protein